MAKVLSITNRVLAVALALTVLFGTIPGISAARITHGTSSQTITEDMLDTTPDAGYTINPSTQAAAKEGKYNAYFLDTQLQDVYIEIDENNLNYLLQNAVDEPYVMTQSVTIGDTTLGYCGLKTKGNYTLYHSYHDNAGSDRFSFTVNFGKYITKADYGEKQNFYGCEKISFNNFFFDKSMMKEFFALKLMDEMGLPTPQYGLCRLYINGGYYGVYFMVEAMDETILEQYWNCSGKEISPYLVKPTGTNFSYVNLSKDDSPLWEYDEDTYADVESMLPTVLDWSKKLTNLSNGRDFKGNPMDVQSQDYLDLLSTIYNVDEIVKYFAVASWLCQMDNMFTNYQNFGLYISEAGVATLLPWDYDLAFGCYYPSTAETTANYPIDVMYRLELGQYQWEPNVSKGTYDDFPLFYVIYQNDALMDLYHTYMAECSQIAALGGTVASTGKSYDPGYFNSYIEAMQDELLEAAAAELADNVYYMNNIRQPEGVEDALPNLAKIIAMRSVAVWQQVNGNTTTVCGAGCDLETLGNAITGSFSNSGNLTIVDAGTGIFATANYTGGKRAISPSLTLTPVTSGNDYDAIRSELETEKRDTLLIYNATLPVKAASEYKLTIPVAQEHLTEGTALNFYTYVDDQLVSLEMTQDGNLFTGTAEKIDCIVIHVQPEADYTVPIVISIAGGILVAAAIVLLVAKRKKAQ